MLLEEFEILCGDVGLSHPSVFERQALIQCTKYKNRDMVFEIAPHDTVLPGGIIPSLLKERQTKHSDQRHQLSHLILLDKQLLETALSFVSLFRETKRSTYRSCSVIGANGNARQDLREFSRLPEVLISTPERLIDHIRRENISLTDIRKLTVIRPQASEEELNGFDQDVLFIQSKLKNASALHLFTSSLPDIDERKMFLKRPKVITRAEWNRVITSCTAVLCPSLSPQDICDVLHAYAISQTHILCSTETEKTAITQQFSSAGTDIEAVISTFQEYPLTMSPHSTTVVFYGLPPSVLDYSIPEASQIVILYQREQEETLQVIQERFTMKLSQQNKPTDQEVLRGKIKLLLEEVKQYKHPEDLAKIKRIIKKSIPFHLRFYVFAYLLKEKSGELASSDQKQEESDDQENMVTLFISIGKNRKVYPKDLIKLFKQQLSITDSNIGSVRVLDNYSFINISQEYAQRAIESMDNMKYRGRNITVNFAKKKTS